MRLPAIDWTSISHSYPETTMFGAIDLSAKKFPNAPAFDFMDKITSFKELIDKVETAARAFLSFGVKTNDVVTICMPNTPQAIICLYALNRIGAVANMVHPLSSEKNITFYLDFSESKMILTLDQFYPKVKKACAQSKHGAVVIVARIQDELPFVKSVLYRKFKNEENMKYPDDAADVTWNSFMKLGKSEALPPIEYKSDKTAVILYSGGTSGIPKGIQLTDYNFNALGMQIAEICGCNLTYGCKFLSVMPIFHGFGLGIGIHTILENGAMCILIPQFTKESYAEVVIKKKPNFIAGVPTLFEALLRVDAFKNADLSFLIGVFSGGDALNPELKKKVDNFFKEHNAAVQIREGYGLTECVTASCVTPVHKSKTGSIGLPLRDMEYKIVQPDTFVELPIGEKGEIIISGPTLMAGYMNNQEENDKTLRKDSNGKTWLFTGDLGSVDKEGFVYFHQRIKRMIITSGYNVYPSHVERILDNHPDVDCSCVIGMPDPYKMQKIRAYITLKSGVAESEEEKEKILNYCKEYLDVYEMPQEILFKQELPKTLVGKVAYHMLEEEAALETNVVFNAIKELLGVEDIDFSDNFISLGGNSLKALELKCLLEEKGYDISLNNIFNSTDMQMLTKRLHAVKQDSDKIQYSSSLCITSAQKRIFTAQMMDSESTMYNNTIVFKTNEINPEKLADAVNKLIVRHESLRTRFESKDGQIVQVIEDTAIVHVEELASEDMNVFVKPFDLAKAPLLRVGYCGDTVMIDMHHIISDGGTMPVFFRELNELYMGRELCSEVVQYGEFAMQEIDTRASEAYWLSVFDDEMPAFELPTDLPRGDRQSFSGRALYDVIDMKLHNRITAKCKELNITPFVFYIACFNILLSTYSGNEDIVVGMPVSGRSAKYLDTIGMFVNTVVLRNKPDGAKTIAGFLQEVKENVIAAIEHQDYPFGELVKKLSIEINGRNPLFDVMFVYQSEQLTDIVFGDQPAALLPVPVTSSKYDFTFNIFPRREDVVVMVEYCTDLYKKQKIQKFIDSFKKILEQLLQDNVSIRNIETVAAEEKQQLLYEFNATAADYPKDKCIHELFEEQVKKTPDKVAVVAVDKQLTYKELNEEANRIAHALIEKGVGRGDIVALLLPRMGFLLSALFGILKTGAAYLPIDPDYPQERIGYILCDSAAKFCITQENIAELIADAHTCDPAVTVGGNDRCYCIYTSGSTGEPKGACISHASICNRIFWMNEKYPLDVDSVILQKTPYTFDVSVWELFWWSIMGASLALIAPGEHFLPAKILQAVSDNAVSHLHFVPSVFDLFLTYLENNPQECRKFASVKQVFLSGEALTAALVNRFYALFDYEEVKLANLYGPTECTVDVTFFDCAPDIVDPIPIGKPVSNTQCYITDKNMRLCPVGVKGELCIGGANVGMGYLNRPGLTAEKFVDNPFGAGKLYRTGDLAYWREDGNIIFCGRMDGQIKLHGQRIEIGEIETAISQVQNVESVCVQLRMFDSQPKLVAFYSARCDMQAEILACCAQHLPQYMIPSAFVRLDAIPLNANGKTDRKKLSQMPVSLHPVSEQAESPQTETERRICFAFEKELGVSIGRNDHFFRMGGTSLSMISLLSQPLFANVSAADFIAHPTPAQLAPYIKSKQNDFCKLHLLHEASQAQKALVLFPYAGGGAQAFAQLVNAFADKTDQYNIYCTDYLHSEAECQEAADEIRTLCEQTEVFFYSHCAGSAVAMQVLNLLAKDGDAQIRHFAAGGNIPLAHPPKTNIWRRLPKCLMEKILLKAGAPLQALAKEQREEMLVHFLEDTDFLFSYFASDPPRVTCPVSLLLSKRDPFTENWKQAMPLWQNYADIKFIHYIETDSHYFQARNSSETAAILLSVFS